MMKRVILFLTMVCCLFCISSAWADGQVTCPSCGAAASGKFCSSCGTRLSSEWTCSSCGATVSSGNFCSNCGAKRGGDGSSASAPTPAPAEASLNNSARVTINGETSIYYMKDAELTDNGQIRVSLYTLTPRGDLDTMIRLLIPDHLGVGNYTNKNKKNAYDSVCVTYGMRYTPGGFSDCYWNLGDEYKYNVTIKERNASWTHYVIEGEAPLYKMGDRKNGKIYDCTFEVDFTMGERHPMMQEYVQSH